MELAANKTFLVATDVRVYFCDPRSYWQRGLSENTNGLLRQYFTSRTGDTLWVREKPSPFSSRSTGF